MIYSNSRYIKTNLRSNEGQLVFEIRRRLTFVDTSDYYVFTQGDRLDLLANKFYEDRQLWWVFLEANPQFRTGLEITPGTVLIIPKREEVEAWTTY